ncbi:MAG TPA: Asp-tRNA(Asn)/Glu-tRNA(Gln) amidotransferase subunit GatC [Candidatus Wirthbacteria bacterium]|nr:Asp-tRNA(Asn)/Glu-tRNA(Gln) amidotransferase subunit GatC [Candidatus Wirthbacteria bacterium]
MSEEIKLTREQTLNVAYLADLVLSEEEIEKFRSWLKEALDCTLVLQELDTTHLLQVGHITGLTNVWQEDVIKPSLTQEQALANAPRSLAGYFRVNCVLEK